MTPKYRALKFAARSSKNAFELFLYTPSRWRCVLAHNFNRSKRLAEIKTCYPDTKNCRAMRNVIIDHRVQRLEAYEAELLRLGNAHRTNIYNIEDGKHSWCRCPGRRIYKKLWTIPKYWLWCSACTHESDSHFLRHDKVHARLEPKRTVLCREPKICAHQMTGEIKNI